MRRWILQALGVALISGTAAAQDGKVLYETYCGACHAPDGKGMNDGQFPPLAGSEWILGKPDRMVQAVLHGMQGEITVAGKAYNLVMPPQGAALTDDQLSKIVTYVRARFGGGGSAVSPKGIVAQRVATKGRTEMWKGKQLLKAFPLPKQSKDTHIKNLISKVYEGEFKSLKDLAKAKAGTFEEEHDGLIRIDNIGKKENFGVVWEGDLQVPKDGEFSFELDSDDGSGVYIDGKQVAVLDRIGGMGKPVKRKVKLTKGSHKIRVAYYELKGREGISLAWSGPGLKGKQSLSRTAPKGKKPQVSSGLLIVPPAGEAVIYRNFIEGTTPRAIGVGYDGGVNLAFSTDTMSLDLIWTGKFMDGSRHWINRGQGNQPPAGDKVLKISKGPAFTILESQTTAWPGEYAEALKPKFNGYQLNAKQEPTFFYTLGKLEISDCPTPVAGKESFVRTITINSPTDGPENLSFRASIDWPVQQLASHRYDLGGQVVLEISQAGTGQPYVRNGNELIVPIVLKKDENTITLSYSWN